MTLASTLDFIVSHPLNRQRPLVAVGRCLAWQIGSRLKREHVHSWIGGAKLVVKRGMHGATGNIYCGLHEYADMAFVLHLLRPGDVFLDIGANIGSYSVLASGVCGARSIAFEPDSDAAARLTLNVAINGIAQLVDVHEIALGAVEGMARFTAGLDTTNRISADGARRVPMRRLDDIPDVRGAVLMKLDVEGYEGQVLAGAREVLSSPSLIAVETEACDAAIQATFDAGGFTRRYYDPVRRVLSPDPIPGLRQCNALFVRDESRVQERVKGAVQRRIHGVCL